MLNRFLLIVFAIVLFACGVAATAQSELGDSFSGQDLHLAAPTMTIYKPTDTGTDHILVFEQGFSMSIGDNHLAAESADLDEMVVTKDLEETRSPHIHRETAFLRP